MAILPNFQNSAHNNLILSRMKYNYIKGALGATDTLLKAYILNVDNPLNHKVINPNTPLLAPRTALSYQFQLETLLANKNLFENNALSVLNNPKIYTVLGLIHNYSVQINAEISEPTPFIFARVPESIYQKFEQTYFQNLRLMGSPFLTVSPRLKRTKSTTPQYLHYLNNLIDTPTQISLMCTLRLHDDTPITFIYDSIANPSPNQIIGCDVSLSKMLESQTHLPEDVASYEIYLINQNNVPITETRIYLVDDAFAEDTITLLFRNCFGVFETLEFDGQAIFTDDYTYNTFQAEEQVIDYDTTVIEKLNLKTTALEKDWLKFIAEDLLFSDEIYMLLPDGSHRQLSKTTKTLKKYDSRAVTETAELEFRIAKI